MRQPKTMFHDIVEDIADAETHLERSMESGANEWGLLCAIRSIADSQLAIAKLLLRQEAE